MTETQEIPMVVTLDRPVLWQRQGDVLRVKGIALTAGTYKGLDGKTITYSPEVVEAAASSLQGKAMWNEHLRPGEDAKQRAPVGFMNGSGYGGQSAYYEGIVYNQDMMARIEEHPEYRASMESWVWGRPKPGLPGAFNASRFEVRGLVYTQNPADKTAGNQSVEAVALSETLKQQVTPPMSDEQPNGDKTPQETPSQPTVDLSAFEAKLEAMLEAKLSKVSKQLETVEAELERGRQEKIEGLLSQIREFDPEFKEDTVALSAVADFDSKEAVLNAYLAGVKQKKENVTQVAASAAPAAADAPGSQVPAEGETKTNVQLANDFCQTALGLSYEDVMKNDGGGLTAHLESGDDMYPLEWLEGDDQ